jgi:hypothetical protein
VRSDGGGGALEERPCASEEVTLGGDRNEKRGWPKLGPKKTDAPSVFWEPGYLVYGGLQWPG